MVILCYNVLCAVGKDALPNNQKEKTMKTQNDKPQIRKLNPFVNCAGGAEFRREGNNHAAPIYYGDADGKFYAVRLKHRGALYFAAVNKDGAVISEWFDDKHRAADIVRIASKNPKHYRKTDCHRCGKTIYAEGVHGECAVWIPEGYDYDGNGDTSERHICNNCHAKAGYPTRNW